MIQEHPMDNFPVRPLEFDVNHVEFGDPLWSRTSPKFSMFVNALGVHVPYFERYLIFSLSQAKKHVTDAKLLKDISAIIGQEGHHAKNFIEVNKWLAERYPKVALFDEDSRKYFANHAKSDDLKKLVGFTAGYETFTFLAGMIILDNYDKWFSDSDPVMKAIWVWHQVEEVEHGAVAFEVYKHLFGNDEWYRKWMVFHALLHIAYETLRNYFHMSVREGWFRNPLKGVSRMGFCCKMLARFVKSALPVFSKKYHPRLHPMVNADQNAIQIAWRKFYDDGGEVLDIDRHKMTEIMGS